MQEPGHLPEMLAGVELVVDLEDVVKMQIGEVPDPLGPVAHDYFLSGSVPTAILGFGIEALAEGLGGFDGSGVGGRMRVADGKAFLIIGGLGEDASQFDFSGTSWPVFDLAHGTLGLGDRD